MIILYIPRFVRQYKKLPREIKDQAKNKESIFRQNPFDPQLKTHKLKGSFEGYWSFSITQKYRIIFEFQDENVIRFYSIGDHDIYQ